MKKQTLLTLALLATTQLAISADYVQGYFKKNGTYVNGYHKTHPNKTAWDNYSTAGNYNPYTGKIGKKHPNKKHNYFNFGTNIYGN